jgi:DNA invertase Pin-like site-specific DNA recombinase
MSDVGGQISHRYVSHQKASRQDVTGRNCRDAALREFDIVMAWSVDRLGRSLQDLVGFLSELHALKIDLFLRQQGLDTTTPAGRAMFQPAGRCFRCWACLPNSNGR